MNPTPEEFTVLQGMVSTQTHDHINQHLTYGIPQHASVVKITSFDNINYKFLNLLINFN